MSKVSIIMPSFNVVSYIRECMNSVLSQTLTDIEIIVVDADSTDGTREILEEYAQKDGRVVILRQDKKSCGYANNKAIKYATGEYIGIVETDDYIAPDMMEKLYQKAKEYDLDIVKGNYRSFLGEGDSRLFVDKAISLNRGDYEKVIDPQLDNCCFGWDMYTWTGLYKKKFLEEYQILHNESEGAAFQDVGFWFQTYCYARKVYLMKDYFYYYRRDNPNASVKNPNRTFIMCDEYKFVKDIISKDRKTWERVKPAYYHGMFRSYFVTYERLAPHLKPEFADRFYREIKEGYEEGWIRRELFDEYELKYLDILLTSKEEFERALASQKLGMEKKRKNLFQRISNYPHCVIFSAGSHGCNLQVMLRQDFQINIVAFCDNDMLKYGKKINGVKVLSLEKTVELFPDCIYLVANKKYSSEIQKQLEFAGIKQESIIICKVEELIDGFL